MSQEVKWFPGVNVQKLYPSLQGKRVLITGGGGSLGLEASTQLAKLGAKVYLSDITQEMAVAAVKKISDKVEGSDVVATPGLDLNSFKNIRAFVKWLENEEEHLDILINNTGTGYMDMKPFDTEDGFAGRAQVNFLGHYVLTRLLEHLLVPGSRIITVASVFHRFGKALHPENLLKNWEGGLYPNCKLALVMFTKLLQEKWKDKGVVCVAVDPGAVFTGIWSSSRILSSPPMSWILKMVLCPPEDAVAVYIHTAATKDITPGGYYARGVFALDFITKGPTEEGPMIFRIWLMSNWDWFLRWITRGAILSSTRRVAVASEASKMEIAEELWNYCADAAGLPK